MMKLCLDEILNAIAWQGLERDVFMHLFRNSDRLHRQLSPDDCCEVFAEILQGQSDIDKELLKGLENDYDVDLVKILTEEEEN
nr:MAG TPA: Regulatory-associated protein of TOR 1,Ribosomal, TOS, PROTEIN BINDING.11A [Caudoviricetes sp.]